MKAKMYTKSKKKGGNQTQNNTLKANEDIIGLKGFSIFSDTVKKNEIDHVADKN